MQVSNLYLRNVKVGQTEPGGTAGLVPAQPTGAVNPVPASSTYVSSAEFQQLLKLSAQEPMVREDELVRVAARLATGELLRPEAALQTADALLNAEE